MSNEKNLLDLIPDEDLDEMGKKLGIEEDENTEETVEVETKKTTKKSSSNKKKTVKEENNEDKNTEETKKENNINKLINKSNDKLAAEEFLGSIAVDLTNIELVETKEIEKFETIDFILNGKSTYQVAASQSCYFAFMEPLKMSDINAITNSTLDVYQSRMKLYQTVYSKMNTTSLGKISFKDWLRITSYFDFPTLLYGIYMQTFPGNTDFTIKCRHCNSNIDVKINNDTLVSVKDNSVFEQMEKIATTVTNPEEALNSSVVNKYQRVLLPDSKIVIEVQTPSLANHLDLLGSVDPKRMAEVEEIITTLLFIKNIYMLDVRATNKTKTAKFFEVKNRMDKVNIINKLSIADYKALAEAMSDRIEKYAIEYKIKDFPCTNCGKSIGEIPIDIEALLFQQILQL